MIGQCAGCDTLTIINIWSSTRLKTGKLIKKRWCEKCLEKARKFQRENDISFLENT